MNELMKVSQIIRSASTIYITTENQPKESGSLLPIQLILDNKLFLGVASDKPIYKQMKDCPNVTITTSKEGHIMYYSGKAVFETEPVAASLILDNNPTLKAIYSSPKKELKMFHITDASVRVTNFNGKDEESFKL